MQVDILSVITAVSIASIVSLGIGYLLGHFGLSGISNDISEIKGLISGSQKISIVPSSVASNPAPATVVVPANSTAA